MSLGERIKSYRKMNQLSQESVGELVGVSRQAVTRWETNYSAPSTDNLIKLATIFNITLEELISDNSEVVNDSPKKSENKIKSKIAIVWGSIMLCLIIAVIVTLNALLWTIINIMILLTSVVVGIYIVALLIRALNKYIRS